MKYPVIFKTFSGFCGIRKSAKIVCNGILHNIPSNTPTLLTIIVGCI